MTQNRGKQFENVVRQSFLSVPDVSVIRLPDQTMGYAGSANICDFIVYFYPNQFLIECKSVHGNTLPFSNISTRQWDGLLAQSRNSGVICGILCWWIDRGVTKFISIQELAKTASIDPNRRSIRYDTSLGIELDGRRKRLFFEYDMLDFLQRAREKYEHL